MCVNDLRKIVSDYCIVEKICITDISNYNTDVHITHGYTHCCALVPYLTRAVKGESRNRWKGTWLGGDLGARKNWNMFHSTFLHWIGDFWVFSEFRQSQQLQIIKWQTLYPRASLAIKRKKLPSLEWSSTRAQSLLHSAFGYSSSWKAG